MPRARVAFLCALGPLLVVANARAAEFTEVWLGVSLNDQSSGDVSLFLREPDGRLLAPASLLKSLRLRLPAEAGVEHSGQRYVLLDDFSGLTYSVDEDQQVVALHAPARLFKGTTLRVFGAEYAPAPPAPVGGFMNYDLVATSANGDTGMSGQFQGSLFGPYGAGVTTYLAHALDGGGEGVRLDSTWTKDFPQSITSLTLGDSITGASDYWGGAVHFGGIQWSSNYAIRPDMITMPLPGVSGEAVVPSALDLYVDNALRYSGNVPSGPFRIDDIPVVTGEGQVNVVVTNSLGQQQVITQSYYASPELLRAGLQDFSLEAGAVRENYGLASGDYGLPLLVGTDRVGLTDQLTVEAHGEVLREQQTLGFSAASLLGQSLVLSSSAAASHAGQGEGELVVLGLEHTARRLSFDVNVQYATSAFTRLGLVPGQPVPRLTGQAYVTLATRHLGSFSVSQTEESFWNAPSIKISSARETFDLGRIGYLALTAVRTRGSTSDTTLELSFTHSLGARTSASTTLTSDTNSGSDGQVDVQQNLPEGRGMGYRLVADAGANHFVDGTVSLQNDVGTYQLEADQSAAGTAVQASAAGSVVALSDRLFASREIQDSFALVEVGGQPNVTVYSENQPVGQTDSKGYLLVPDLRAYENNSVGIEQADLPLDAIVDTTQAAAVPAFRSGVIVKFPVERPSAALISVRLEDGRMLPTGALVQVVGKKDQFPSGFNGEVYVTGLEAHNRVRVQWDGGRCEFSMAYYRTSNPLPRLGPFACKRIAP
jgi:outer membrane usher protein